MNLINVQLKNAAGRIVDSQAAEIISIDGKPYEGSSDSIHDVLVNHAARLEQLERFIAAQLQQRE